MLCTICRSTWGPTGSAFTSGSEPDTDCLLYHVTAGHCFRDTFDAPWENNDIGSVKIWIWEWAKRSLWLLVVRCAWDPPLYRLCVVLCTICRSTWGPTGSAFTSGSEPDTDCLLYHVAAGHCFRDTFDEQWENNDIGSVKIWIWEWAKRSLWLLAVRCAWDPSLYRLCVVLCTICRSTWGPTGSAFTSGSEPDTDCLLYHVAAGDCFRDTFDEQWENNDIGSVKIWIWEWAKRSLWLLVVRCAWDPPLYRLCVVLCTICRSTWGPTGSAFTSGSEPDTDCLLYHVAAGHCFRDTFDEQWESNDIGSVKIWIWEWAKRSLWLLVVRCAWDPPLYRLCVVLCTICRSTWGPTGSAFTSGSEPDTDCLLYHVTAGHCFRDTFDAPWENNDIGSVKIWIWEWAKRSLWLLVVRCAWDPPLYRLCVVLCTICRSTWGPTGSAFTSGSEPDTDCLLYHVAAGHCFRDIWRTQG